MWVDWLDSIRLAACGFNHRQHISPADVCVSAVRVFPDPVFRACPDAALGRARAMLANESSATAGLARWNCLAIGQRHHKTLGGWTLQRPPISETRERIAVLGEAAMKIWISGLIALVIAALPAPRAAASDIFFNAP